MDLNREKPIRSSKITSQELLKRTRQRSRSRSRSPMLEKSLDSSNEAIRKNKRRTSLKKSERLFKPKENKLFESQKFSPPLTHVDLSAKSSQEKSKSELNYKAKENCHREPLFREAFVCLAAPTLTNTQRTL